jgi:hypothetical protein
MLNFQQFMRKEVIIPGVDSFLLENKEGKNLHLE